MRRTEDDDVPSRSFGPRPTVKVATTARLSASIAETVPATMFVTKTYRPSVLVATPCAPAPVRIVAITLPVAVSITDTVSAGSASGTEVDQT